MKKKQNVKILSVLAVTCLISAGAGFGVVKANAAVTENVGYVDTFDNATGSLDEKWNAIGGASVKADYTAMRINTDDYSWGGHIVNTKYKLKYDEIKSSCQISVVLERTKDDGAWFAFSYGSEDPSYEFPYASGAVITYSNGCSLFKSINGALDDSGGIKNFNIFHGKKVKVVFEFTKTVIRNEYRLVGKCYDYTTDDLLSSFSFGVVRVNDGYFGFNSSRMKVDLYDFSAYEDGKLVYEDDFSNSSLAYVTSSIEDPDWRCSKAWNEDNLIVGTIGKLDVRKTGSGVLYSTPYKTEGEGQLNLLYTLSANFFVGGMNGADTGFVVGTDENGNGGSFIGVRKTSLSSSMVFYNGDEEPQTLGRFTSPTLNLNLKVYYDNTLELSVGGEVFKYTAKCVDGYFGIKTNGSETGVGATVDEFAYASKQYVKRVAKDMSVRFDDYIGTEIMDMTVYDYYVSSKDWYKSNASLPIIMGTNGYLIFTNAGDFSCLAPKQKYNDFIVRFDITFTSVNFGTAFGIEVGKTDLSESYSNSVNVGFRNENGQTVYAGNKCVSSTGLSTGAVSSYGNDLFNTNQTYNFMAIAENGTVTLHYKSSLEDESVLAYERAKFVDVNTDGYVAMFLYYGSATVDNFSVVNLDYEYFSEGYQGGENVESFRYDFGVTKDISGVETEQKVLGETLEIGDGLSSVGKVGANITRFKVADMNGDLSYKHGNLTVKIDKANNKILVNDGVNMQNADMPKGFVYEDAFFEIRELTKKVKVSCVSGDKPVMTVVDNEHEFTVVENTTDKITLSSADYVTVKQLGVFNLDTNVTIPAGLYVPETARKVRPSIQEIEGNKTQKKGCNASLGLGALPLILGLAYVGLKKKEEN